ncbi:MAG: hypothetical protein COA47_02615 [Robiginitomaculum sp.]|nr:MAG: hypothetical protein COA47_02615 [Robiginitomaculum sp.]
MNDRRSGLSLLEMLVVLAIMGMMVSLIGARLVTSVESTRFSRTADAAIAGIKIMRVEAMLGGIAYQIREIEPNSSSGQRFNVQIRRFDLPDGWQHLGDVIEISETGFCSGGRVTLKGPSGRLATYQLDPPRCEGTRIVSAAAK